MATDNIAVNKAADILKKADIYTLKKGDHQDSIGVYTNLLLDSPNLPITSINSDINIIARKLPASVFPETPTINISSSQSLREDPGNTLYTTVPLFEDNNKCGIQYGTSPKLAYQAPSNRTPTAFHLSILGQEKRLSLYISIAILADLPLSTANTTNTLYSHSNSKVQLKDYRDPIDILDSERQDSDNPDNNDYFEIQPNNGNNNNNLSCP